MTNTLYINADFWLYLRDTGTNLYICIYKDVYQLHKSFKVRCTVSIFVYGGSHYEMPAKISIWTMCVCQRQKKSFFSLYFVGFFLIILSKLSFLKTAIKVNEAQTVLYFNVDGENWAFWEHRFKLTLSQHGACEHVHFCSLFICRLMKAKVLKLFWTAALKGKVKSLLSTERDMAQ